MCHFDALSVVRGNDIAMFSILQNCIVGQMLN